MANQPYNGKKSRSSLVTICAVGAALIVGLPLAVLGFTSWMQSGIEDVNRSAARYPAQADEVTPSQPVATPTPQPTQDPRTIVYSPGEAVSIGEGKGGVFVATTLDGAKALTTAQEADDDTGVRNLLAENSIFPLAVGTEGKVLENDNSKFLYTYIHIRIMSGELAGNDGWIQDLALKPK